uniref:Uncharacterized protein n=1 Tax=Solanum tuberosum TaxID=4113 RepID=M1CKS3_SOLTU
MLICLTVRAGLKSHRRIEFDVICKATGKFNKLLPERSPEQFDYEHVAHGRSALVSICLIVL